MTWQIHLTLILGLFLADSVKSDAPTKPGTSELTLVSSPAVVFEGLTQTLDLNCSFVPRPGSDFNVVISLILSKADGVADSYKELAAVSQVSRHAVNVKDSLRAQVSGELPVTGLTYIHYLWTYPGHEVSGRYRCQLHGVDTFGHPLLASAEATITEKPVDNDVYHDAILEKFKQLENIVESQKIQLDQQTIRLKQHEEKFDDKQAQLDGLKIRLDEQNKELGELHTRVNDSGAAIMAFSGSFRGHQYQLSHVFWRNVAHFDSLCRLHGGYLLEIDDQQEYDFVYSFLKANHVTDRVYIGGTDAGHQGNYTFQRSGDGLGFFIWGSGQPNSAADCVILYENVDMKMATDYCHDNDWRRFMCESP